MYNPKDKKHTTTDYISIQILIKRSNKMLITQAKLGLQIIKISAKAYLQKFASNPLYSDIILLPLQNWSWVAGSSSAQG